MDESSAYNIRKSFSFFSIADAILLATLFLFLCLLCSCKEAGQQSSAQKAREDDPVTLTDTVMGTVAQATLYGVGKERAGQLLERVKELETECLSGKLDSAEVSAINARVAMADGEEVEISPELYKLLQSCLQISGDSLGAFDVTLGRLCRLWNMDEIASGNARGMVPSDEEIRRAMDHCGFEKLILLGENRILPEPGMALELGSVGKGYALDCLHEMIVRWGSSEDRAGVIALGGSIMTFGEKAPGIPWRVGIKDPDDSAGIIGYLELYGENYISTSGDYERFFEQNGERYHHILDPETGYPARSGLRSVTILAANGFLSDALSTACFVLGAERGMKLADQYGAEVLMVNEEGEILLSDGMREIFHAATP